MRAYGKVHASFWTSPDIRAMSDDARTVALYLLTSEHGTIIGAFRMPDAFAAEGLGWSTPRASKGLAELFRNGFATRDEGTGWLVVGRWLRWNPLENPNQAKAAARMATQVRGPAAVAALSKAFADFGGRFAPDWNPSETVAQTIPEPFRNQHQDQDQDQDQDSDPGTVPEPSPAARPPKAPRARPRTTCPASVDPIAHEWLAANGIPPMSPTAEGREVAKMLDHHRGKGSLMADWCATWRTWRRNAVEFGKLPAVAAVPPKRPARNPADIQRELAALAEESARQQADAIRAIRSA